jgi:hypothetical protein
MENKIKPQAGTGFAGVQTITKEAALVKTQIAVSKKQHKLQ